MGTFALPEKQSQVRFGAKLQTVSCDNCGVTAPEELLLGIAEGSESLADALGVDRAALDRLVDEAMARASSGQLEEAERSLQDLAVVHGTSALLPCLLAGVRAERGDALGAASAYTEALRRAEVHGAEASFVAELLLLRAAARRGTEDAAGAREDLLAASRLEGTAAEEARRLLGMQ